MARGIEARRIAFSLAGEQAGVIARRQLKANRLSDGLINHWLKSGYLFRFLPGVYSLGRPADSAEAFRMAGFLFAGVSSVLAGESAAHALGFADSTSRIEVVRPAGARRSLAGCPPHNRLTFLVRRGQVKSEDTVQVAGVPVMNTARVLIDLAGRTPESSLRRYFVEAGCSGLLTAECLDRIEEGSRGFAGRSSLLALKRKWDPSGGRVRSVLEGEFRLLCAERGIRSPLMNQRIGRYEVDAVWIEAKLAVELDGRKFHQGGIALEKDTAKTHDLNEAGYRVLRFTWNDVIERPEWVAEQLCLHLRDT